jgi:Ca-activated chloride channel family protein
MRRSAICLALPLLSCATQSKDPNLVELTAALQNQYVQAQQPQELIARLRVGTRPLAAEGRQPIHLALVIDTSGSMEGQAIADARAAAITLVDSLDDGDRVSVIGFHSTTDLIVPSTEIDRGTKLLIRKKLESIEAKGTTDLAGGLHRAIEQLAIQRDGEIRRVVLLSDGLPNDPGPIASLASQLSSYGAPITALGLGLEFDETLLAQIAQLSGGKFHFIEDSKQVASVFQQEVLRLDRSVAKNAVLELMPGPGVTIAGVIGRSPVASGRGLQIPLGDLGEDETRDVLIRLQITPRADTAAVELMDAVLSFDDATSYGERFERRLFLSARSTGNAKNIDEGENSEVTRAYARQEAAALTMEAIREARQGNLSGSQAILQHAEQVTRENASKYGDPLLQRSLVEIIELQKRRDERSSKQAYDNAMRLIY